MARKEMMMDFKTHTDDDLRIVSVQEKRIDAAVAIEFKDGFRSHTDGGPQNIILDLSSVDFIDSSGLGAIVASIKTLGAERQMALAGLTPTVEKVFKLTRMDSVFNVFPTVDGALNWVRN